MLFRSAILVLLQVVKVLRCNLEHLTSSLAVRCSNEGRVEVVVAVLVEVGVNGHSHVVANTHYGTECVGA